MSPDTKAKFGKHKGKTVAWIQKFDWRYFEWAKANAPGMFQDSPSSRSKPVDQNWGKPPGAFEASTKFEVPPERDDNDPNSSSFLYNLAKRMLDNGEL